MCPTELSCDGVHKRNMHDFWLQANFRVNSLTVVTYAPLLLMSCCSVTMITYHCVISISTILFSLHESEQTH